MFKCCQSHCQHERDFQRHHIITLSTRDMHQMHYYHIINFITLSTRWEERGEGGQIIHGPSEKYFSFYFFILLSLFTFKIALGNDPWAQWKVLFLFHKMVSWACWCYQLWLYHNFCHNLWTWWSTLVENLNEDYQQRCLSVWKESRKVELLQCQVNWLYLKAL